MGTRVIDTTTGTVVATAHGTAYTDELERAYVEIDMAVNADRKRDQAQKLINRLRQSADSIDKLQRRVDGMRKAHGASVGELTAHGTLPDGYSVEWEDVEGDTPVTPKRLVAPEESASVPEQTDESAPEPSAKPNRFDAIALEAANA